MDINITPEILQIVKVLALLFALFHLLVGFVLSRRVGRINRIIFTSKSWLITFINYIHIAVLVLVIALIALI